MFQTGYNELNTLGFKHYSVIHKDRFKCQYKEDIGETPEGEEPREPEVLSVDTSTIEAWWAIIKERLKLMRGISIA